MMEGWSRKKGLMLALAAAAAQASSGGLRDYVGRNIAHNTTQDTSRSAWMPHSPARPVASINTLRGNWSFDPSAANHSVIFVLLGRDDPLPGLSWEDRRTQKWAWAGRPQTEFVFLPLASDVDVSAKLHEALDELPPEEKDYWVPRLHFSTATMSELRQQGHWVPQYVDAWSEVLPSVAARYTKGENSHSWGLKMIDAQVPRGGLTRSNQTDKGVCMGEVEGACGVVGFGGLLCRDEEGIAGGAFSLNELRGKIVLVPQTMCSIGEKVSRAKAAGAVGVLVWSDGTPDNPFTDSVEKDLAKLPVEMVSVDDGEWLMSRVRNGDIIHAYMFNRTSTPWAFGVDRQGHLRRMERGAGSLAAAVLEALNWDYEAVVHSAVESKTGTTDVIVPVLPGDESTWTTMELPEEVTDRPNSQLKVVVELNCEDRIEELCPTLSQTLEVMVCEAAATGPEGYVADNLSSCAGPATRIAQIRTAAGREMMSTVDASPFLGAVIPKDATRRTRLYLSGMTGLRAKVTMVISEAQDRELVPFSVYAVPVTTTLPDNSSLSVDLPSGVETCALTVSLTGEPRSHDDTRSFSFRMCSNSFDGSDCTLEGPFMLFPDTGGFRCSNETMMTDTKNHVVPNQLGDWWSGRPGYCPGRAVFPVKRLLTSISPGGSVTITPLQQFTAAQPNPHEGQPGHVDLSAYLVCSGRAPAPPTAVEVQFAGDDDDGKDMARSGVLTATLPRQGSAPEGEVDAVVSWPGEDGNVTLTAGAPILSYSLTVKAHNVHEKFVFPAGLKSSMGISSNATDTDTSTDQPSQIRVRLNGLQPATGYVLRLHSISSIGPSREKTMFFTVPADANTKSASKGSHATVAQSTQSQPHARSKRNVKVAVALSCGLGLMALVLALVVYVARKAMRSQRQLVNLQDPGHVDGAGSGAEGREVV